MGCGFVPGGGTIEFKEFQNAVMKVVAVNKGTITSDGHTTKAETKLPCIAVVVDDGIIPITDGKNCFATVDGTMNGAKIR